MRELAMRGMLRWVLIVGMLALAPVSAAQPTQAQMEAIRKPFIAERVKLIAAQPCAFDEAALKALANQWTALPGEGEPAAQAQRDFIFYKLQAHQKQKCFDATQADPATRKTVTEIEALYHVLMTSDCPTTQLRDVIPTLSEVKNTLHPGIYEGMYRNTLLQPDNPQHQCVSRIMGRVIFAKSLDELLR